MLLTAYTMANVFLLGIYDQFSDLVWKDAWLLTDHINQVSLNRKHDQLRLGEKTLVWKGKIIIQGTDAAFCTPTQKNPKSHCGRIMTDKTCSGLSTSWKSE